MKLILLQNYPKLGKTGDLVTVKAGFGRNYLIPREIAIRATKDNIVYFEGQRAEIEKMNAEKFAAAQKTAEQIGELMIFIVAQAGEDGRPYGAVSTSDVNKKVLENTGVDIARSHIHFPTPIRSIGIFETELRIHADLTKTILVNIARSESEGLDAAVGFKEGRIKLGAGVSDKELRQKQAEEEALLASSKPYVEVKGEFDDALDAAEGANKKRRKK